MISDAELRFAALELDASREQNASLVWLAIMEVRSVK
jgi:hypothetical protein